jgi:ribonuclease HII
MDMRRQSVGLGPVTASSPGRRLSSVRPNHHVERSLVEEGFELVAGLDEVGRGAWAGPVSVGVVVYPGRVRAPKGLRDSKMLTEERREALFPLVTKWCTDWSVGHADPLECDRLGMTAALRLAARRALAGLTSVPHVVVMDGGHDYVSEPKEPPATGPEQLPLAAPEPRNAAPDLVPPIRTVIRGDATCVSIAAASIVAKVTRDRLMRGLSASFPAFDLDRNKGYPSPTHRTALAGFGLTSLHRRSWSYVDDLVFR